MLSRFFDESGFLKTYWTMESQSLNLPSDIASVNAFLELENFSIALVSRGLLLVNLFRFDFLDFLC